MIVLGLHSMGHDTGACLFRDGRLQFAIETERLTRAKHDGAVHIAIEHLFNETGICRTDVRYIALSTNVRNSLARVRNFADIERDVQSGLSLHAESTCDLLGTPIPCAVVAHEAAHAALACHFAGWREPGLVLVNEGRGTFSRNSSFTWRRSELRLIDRDALPWFATGFGWSLMAYLLGFGDAPSAAGTIMAMAAFAEPSERIRSILLNVPTDLHHLSREAQLGQGATLLSFVSAQKTFEAKAQVVATLQEMFTSTTDTYLMRLLDEAEPSWLGLAGGCALNLPTNTQLRRRSPCAVVVPPNCNDSGQALGAALYAQRVCLGIEPRPFNAYVNGRAITDGDVQTSARKHGIRLRPYDPAFVAARIAAGDVIAMCQEQSEVGPRALGNRSLLASAHIPGMKRTVSEQLKRREWFRPLACTMRSDSFSACFPGTSGSPYMLFSYPMPVGLAPEATHRDGTSRIQTLDSRDNPRLSALLAEYEAATGYQTLINTSLNARGRAIAYSVDDALTDFFEQGADLFVFNDWMASGTRPLASHSTAVSSTS